MSAGWEAFRGALASGEPLALPLALLGGLLMGLNPCCLAFYPAVAATCCASAAADKSALVVKSAAAFAVGTALATSVLGLLAALAGHAVLLFGRWPRYAIALIPLLMGTHLLGWLSLPIPRAAAGWNGRGVAGALLAGLLVPVVIGGCGTPVLAAILSYAAYQGNLVFGALLLFLYGNWIAFTSRGREGGRARPLGGASEMAALGRACCGSTPPEFGFLSARIRAVREGL